MTFVATQGRGTETPPQHRDVVIRASAGTGKTFQLTNRFLRLLDSGAPADGILATTFTRKAAGEILERVVLRLAKAALDDDACRDLAGFLNQPSLTRQRCVELLAQVTRQLHRLRIGTLDSFFAQVCGSFRLELGLPAHWRILDELPERRLKRQAIDELLRQDSAGDVNRIVGLMTKGEAKRSVGQLIEDTVTGLYRVFQETGPEAWQQIPQPVPLSAEKLEQTVEALRAVELPKHKIMEKARAQDVEQAGQDDWERFLKGGIAVKVLSGETTFSKKPIDETVRGIYQTLLKHARAVLLQQLAGQTSATYDLLSRFDAIFRRLKHQARALTFDDLTLRLARFDDGESADTGGTAEQNRWAYRMDAQIAHLLLDEFQDTSLAQWQVLRPIARQTSGGRPERSFFCVGDVKQAIYGWRGGSAELFDALDDELEGLAHEPLNTSFRSAPAIIDTVNRIFTRAAEHPGLGDSADAEAVRDWCRQFQPHTTARSHLSGYACLVTAPQADSRPEQPLVSRQFATGRIADLYRQAPEQSIGVLVKTNQNVARLIFELKQRGVPASEEGGNPLTDSAAVQAMLALVTLADHPGDTAARFLVARSPLGRLVEFTDHRDDRAAGRVSQQVRRLLLTHGYGPVVEQWTVQLSGRGSQRDGHRLEQLAELAYQFQPSATLRPGDFVQWVQSTRVGDPAEAPVRVMTFHQSKGLEFDTVVLPDLDYRLAGQPPAFVVGRPQPTEPPDRICLYRNQNIQALLPDDLSQLFHDQRHGDVSESMCVLYVAVTRAVHALHMIVNPLGKSATASTPAGLLAPALADRSQDIPPGTPLYETGDAAWFEKPSTRPTAIAPPASAEPAEIRLAPLDGGRRRGLERIAPSAREGANRLRLADLLEPMSSEALQRGTLFHTWMEQIEWLDDGRPEEADLRRTATGTTSVNVRRAIAEFYQSLDQPAVAAALSRQAYRPPNHMELPEELTKRLADSHGRLEVSNEHEIAVREGQRLVFGVIDRLVLLYDGDRAVAADIVDFKTDTIPDDDPHALDRKVDYYRGQLNAYRPAVSHVFGIPLDCVKARLVFLGPGVVRALEP